MKESTRHVFHVLMTRFNVRRSGTVDARIVSNHWLRTRLDIFTSVTAPSILAQQRPPDAWLVFFDEQTPPDIRQAINNAIDHIQILRPVYCEAMDAATCKSAVSQVLPPSCDWLITTRLDNDDAIHPDLLNHIHHIASQGGKQFINPTQGLVVANGRLYRKRDFSSPFISCSEPAHDFQTVWIDQHQRLARHGTIHQLKLQDAWMQYVHGGNIANQVRGWRVSPGQININILPSFLKDSLSDISRNELLLDNSLGLINRYSASAIRRLRREWADYRDR